jgi:hypothetical protein
VSVGFWFFFTSGGDGAFMKPIIEAITNISITNSNALVKHFDIISNQERQIIQMIKDLQLDITTINNLLLSMSKK